MKRLLTGMVLAGASLLAGADVVERCVDASGKVTWSDRGCGKTERGEAVYVQPNVVDSGGLRDWNRKSGGSSSSSRRYSDGNAMPVSNAVPKDTSECDNARRMYEADKDRRKTASRDLEYRRSEVRAKCGF